MKTETETNTSKYYGYYPVIAPLIMCSGVGDGKTTACVVAQADELHTKSRALHPGCFRGVSLKPKYWFKRRQLLYEAFENLFPGDAAISDCIRSGDVKAAALLRHLLVHKNGIVDKTHFEESALAPVVFSTMSIGQDVEVDGKLVFEVVQPMINRASELAQLVDKWLEAHV